MIENLTKHAAAGRELTPAEIHGAVECLTDPELNIAAKAEFLSALAQRGETVQEIASFAGELRQRSVAVPPDPATRDEVVLDMCGTGGDRMHTFNISTAASLLVAAAGVRVAKHGNRAITSRAGSADVLEALGIPIHLEPEAVARTLREHHFAFLFAPSYHPAFKHLAPARKLCADRGQRTVFNLLGPLLNPARPSVQLVGVPHPQWCDRIGHVLQALGLRRAMVVSGHVARLDAGQEAAPAGGYLDELSLLGVNTIAEFHQPQAFSVSQLDPGLFPHQPARFSDLRGGDSAANASIIRAILDGTDRGPRRDAVLLNAAAGLLLAGRADSMLEGWHTAADVIDTGAARTTLERLRKT
jgi:anthranilate phosphoribosyltransferase